MQGNIINNSLSKNTVNPLLKVDTNQVKPMEFINVCAM